jgi:Carboxypeptidase regulatory-like domain/TonB dependent receptor/TonB-dependent Receptor Plug Domain
MVVLSLERIALLTVPIHMKRGALALLLIVAFVLQGTIAVLAGTTGSISGSVVDASTQQPIAGARVTAASPSQTVSTTTDGSGRYTFISLSPDTYTISVAEAGVHAAFAVNGVTVQADQTQTVSLAQPPKLKTIGAVTSRAASALVKPGTTADVYSINATTQDKASAFGGGGTLNSAYSAISTVPGVYVAPNQNGYIGAGATLSIRGGDYDQIGYELDGIPVNRSFDNYPSTQLSSLGQQELQVYTGATPANAEGEGISGYINQVIRTGTAPAYRSLDLGIGSPALYNKLSFETGGATPSRLFSYYLGLGGYNQGYRYGDQFNGQSLSNLYGPSIQACQNDGSAAAISANGYYTPRSLAPSCYSASGADYTNGGTTPAYVLGPYAYDSLARVEDRDAVANFHFGVPKKDGTHDDIQVLYDNNHLNNIIADSTNDLGGEALASAANFGSLPYYTDAYQYNGPMGQLLPATYTGGGVTQYSFPGSPSGRAFQSTIPDAQREAFVNNQAVVKAQYQHNFGTNAFLRVYGYTFYSDWLNNGPNSTLQNYLGPVSPDYELSSHARGLSATFSDQLTSQHLLTFQGSYTTANAIRDNNLSMINGLYGANSINKYTAVGVLVDSSNPLNGLCYAPGGINVPCYSVGSNGYASNLNKGAGYFTLQQAYNGTVTPATGTCGGGPCQYLTIGNGSYATYNSVVPKFSSFSLTDNWKPTDKLTVNLGMRFDRFEFDGSNTSNSPARTFWYNAYNNQFPTNLQYNVPSQVEAYNVWQPRAGFTYTVNPATVVRASYGRYGQAPNTAFEQYDFLQPNAPLNLQNFALFGVGNTPAHAIRPEVSNNYDLSLEHQFGGDVSLKLTPFLRKTQDQIQQFYLDQKTNFVSGLNVGRQTSEGIEVELDKGDFARNGVAGRLSFTYTNSYINYTREPNGQSVVDPINAAISSYNGFTKGGGGAPCYFTSGANAGKPDTACASGSVANPYYNAPTQALLDPNGKYPTFDTFPGGIESSYTTFGAPYVTTLLVQYKHGPLAITPALQFSAGQRYGAPETTPGIDPTTCGTPLAPNVAPGDVRYGYGSAGGGAYDATNCTASLAIPDQFTNTFDGIGAFVAPATVQLHLQTTYDLNKHITLVANFANIINRCFGGTKVPFAVSGACGYTTVSGAGSGPQPIGNAYNPGATLQPVLQTPYVPYFAGFPFNMYFEARIKI